ncbi:hypothetical protein P4K91_28265 [Bacillus anthracis]|uniref:hypothetical protein n=1 Tax=Bacillus anthracis TaxID=1392 RepID=UPI002DBF9762|nr:hypothetical protein [Bacillus anthracis]MEB9909172.1 hypothetical protein [Bacillus anthracis]MEC1955975.1 hypothetical protein [Bacillus anthracis]
MVEFMQKNDIVVETKLYKRLIEFAQEVTTNVPAAHPDSFIITDKTIKNYQNLYTNQRGNVNQLKSKPGGVLCSKCDSFYMSVGKKIDKNGDLGLGSELEKCFQKYVQTTLNDILAFNESSVRVRCERADKTNLHMPDFKLVREGDEVDLAYFEFKCIFRPFIKIANRVNVNYRCYSNSLTLDIGSKREKQKLKEQRELVEGDLKAYKVDYVYWYDIPCIKGVFYMSADRVYHHMDTQQVYVRKEAKGDFNKKGNKVGSDEKIYLPLTEMSNIKNLIDKYLDLALYK